MLRSSTSQYQTEIYRASTTTARLMPSLRGPRNFVLEEQAYFGPGYQHTPGRGAVLAATPAASSTPSPEPCCWPGQHTNCYSGHGRGSSPTPALRAVAQHQPRSARAWGHPPGVRSGLGAAGVPGAVPTQPPGCGTEPGASRSVGLVAGLAVTHPPRSVCFSPRTFLFFNFVFFF